MRVSSFSFSWERHQSHLPRVPSRRRVSIVPELDWLPQEFLRPALLIGETEAANGLKSQSSASGGHTKKVDGLSLRKQGAWGSLGKVSAGVLAAWRGVVPSDCRMLNLRVNKEKVLLHWYGTFCRAPASVDLGVYCTLSAIP